MLPVAIRSHSCAIFAKVWLLQKICWKHSKERLKNLDLKLYVPGSLGFMFF